MKFPDSNSPIWPLLRMVVFVVCGVYILSNGYREGWVTRSDFPVLAKWAVSLGLFDLVKYFLAGKEKQ